MRVSPGILWVLFFLVAFGATPSWADVDQLCLKNCVGKGGASGSCLAQCTYGRIVAPTATGPAQALPKPPLSPHRVLSAPVPMGDAVVIARKPSPVMPSKDYACFNQCLSTGSTYGMCEARCTKPVCPSGAVLCGKRTGRTR